MLLACIFLSWMSLAVETAIVLCQSISVYVADLQNVNITLRILFRPIADSLPDIFTNLGIDYDEKVLPSIVNEVLKAVVVSIFLWYILINMPYFLFLNFFLFAKTALWDVSWYDGSARSNCRLWNHCSSLLNSLVSPASVWITFSLTLGQLSSGFRLLGTY